MDQTAAVTDDFGAPRPDAAARTAHPPFFTYRRMARIQSAVYVASGAWPLLHRRSFEAVTGPKVDFWLVRAVASLIGVVGGVLGAASRKPPRTELMALGAGAAAALAAISGTYALRGRISKVYLLDALMEAGLVAGWGAVLLGRRSTP